ncbi:MAG: hypothetical protein ACP6IS_08990 [Candidatus Asgardarchaeia archaeon]
MTILDVLIADESGVPSSITKNGSELPLEIMTPVITTIQTMLKDKSSNLYVNKFKTGNIDYFVLPINNGEKYLIIISENPTKDEEKKIQKTEELASRIPDYNLLLRKVSEIYSEESPREKLKKRGISYLDF